jgi:uncharacterized membrane protein YqjE
MTRDGDRGEERAIAHTVVALRAGSDGAELSTKELLGRIVAEGTALVRTEMELARTELASDLRAEVRAAKVLGAGAVLGLCGVTMVLVTATLALATVLPAWLAGVIVTAAVLVAAGVVATVGWKRRVRQPLARTRRHIKEDVKWMKRRVV